MSDSSRTPPRDIRTYLRPMDLAMDRAMEVLPTPGGPTRQRIWPLMSGDSFRTARDSRIRSFTLVRP